AGTGSQSDGDAAGWNGRAAGVDQGLGLQLAGPVSSGSTADVSERNAARLPGRVRQFGKKPAQSQFTAEGSRVGRRDDRRNVPLFLSRDNRAARGPVAPDDRQLPGDGPKDAQSGEATGRRGCKASLR